MSRWVEKVGQRIVSVSGLGNLDWRFHVIDHPVPNCFVLPGGKVFLFTGMLKLIDSSDALAAILGHEIGN